MDTQFLNEHLGPGKLGHFFVVLSFVAALFSTFSYWRAALSETRDAANSRTWLLMGRNGFIIHTAAIFGIFITLYFIITRHLFEYNYAWEHSSKSLDPKYLLSCFWEGQEGSFMLWAIWHSVLGLFVMKSAGKLETRTMTIIALVQVCLATMLLGFYFGDDVKLGSTPFILLRDKMQNAPIFARGNYLDFITDGNGLNPLLQNYWMVIHPPVLFLGFASTLIPFAFTIAALWKGDYESWVKPTLRWSLFSGGILGLGIMMGGAWAYESLSFGGYWAWDPVENASLVPWLTLVAGLHTLLVYKSTGRSFITTAIFLCLTYLLVWYSTFLTRTGVLGDTSVHAFTGEGKSLYWHLLAVIAVLLVLVIAALAVRWKKLPRVKTEEATSSREFWMFIGSFVLLLSAIQIIISTSLPIWAPLAKAILHKDIAPPVDVVGWYNNIQVWVAIIVAVLTAAILYLRFKKSETRTVWKRLGITFGISLIAAAGICLGMNIHDWQYILLMVTSVFTVVANIYYMLVVQQGNKTKQHERISLLQRIKESLTKRGAAITHLGFGILLVGILISSYCKDVISYNTLGMMIDFKKKTTAENIKETRENAVMYKDIPVRMGDYSATYLGDSVATPYTYFRVRYERYDSASKQLKESFTLYPDVYISSKGGQQQTAANPSSRHYPHKDVFTYVNMFAKAQDTSAYHEHKVKPNDTVYFESGYIVFNGFIKQVQDTRYKPEAGDLGAVSADLSVYNEKGFVQQLKPILVLHKDGVGYIEDTSAALGLYTKLANIVTTEDAAVIMTKENSTKGDYIIMKAIVFPYINAVWLGVIVMVLGFFISLWARKERNKALPQISLKE